MQAHSEQFVLFEQKMQKAGLSKAAIDAFRLNYEQLVGGATGMASSMCFSTLSVCRLSADRVTLTTGARG